MSLDWCIEILEEPLPPRDDDSFGTVVRAKGSAAQTILNQIAHRDDGIMKRQVIDKLPEILALIRQEEKLLPMKLIEAVV